MHIPAVVHRLPQNVRIKSLLLGEEKSRSTSRAARQTHGLRIDRDNGNVSGTDSPLMSEVAEDVPCCPPSRRRRPNVAIHLKRKKEAVSGFVWRVSDPRGGESQSNAEMVMRPGWQGEAEAEGMEIGLVPSLQDWRSQRKRSFGVVRTPSWRCRVWIQ